MKNTLTIYTDGASRGNPGPGGWAAIVLVGGFAMEIGQGVSRATNNQMELDGVIAVLSDAGALAHQGPVIIHSDSAYVINGATKWIKSWRKNGWMTSQKTPVENRERWEALEEAMAPYGARLSFEKVKGHAGERYNERCDELAVAFALGNPPTLFSGTTDAYEAFLQKQGGATGISSGNKKKSASTKAAYSYVSLVKGAVFVDATWDACEKRVKGVKGAKYKKVFSKAEETALVQDYTLKSLS